DSEARKTFALRREEHTFRLGVASFDRLSATGQPIGEPSFMHSDDACDLWRQVAAHATTAHRLVVFAHNAGYHLRRTAALAHLPALGFEVKGLALTAYSCWARFANGKRAIAFVDTTSWIKAPLAEIAADLNIPYKRLPRNDASDEAWYRRCEQDVN